MLVWGGSGRYGQLLPNNIINVYNLTKRSWSIRKTISSPEDTPPLCEFAGSASTPSGRFVYQFGGTRVDYEGQLDYFNNLHVLDTEEFVWKQVCVGSGRRPSPRSLAGMCILGSRLLLFGGLGRRIPNPVPRAEWKEWIMSGKCLNKGWNNELWEISTDNETVSSLSWEPVCCAGDMPKARCDHSFTAVQSSRALLYGGFGSFGHMDDLALFNYEEKAWSSLNLPVQLYRPFCRGEYAAAAVDVPNQGKRIIFLWGCNEKYDIVNDGFALEFVGGEVKECYNFTSPSHVIAARSSTVCPVLQSPNRMLLLIFGGAPYRMLSPMYQPELQLTVLQWDLQRSMELQSVSDTEDIIPSQQMSGSSSLSQTSPVHLPQDTGRDVYLRQIFGQKPENPELKKLLPLIADKWEDVVRCLKPQIPESVIKSIPLQADREPVDNAHVALITWLDQYPNEASVFGLCDALIANNLASCATAVFNFPVEDYKSN